MGKPEKMFAASKAGIARSLRQGEILTNLIQIQVNLESIKTAQNNTNYSLTPIVHPYAIIVSQDCDLEQDFNFRFHKRGKERHRLPSVLFCEVIDAEELRQGERNQNVFQSKTVRKNFLDNNDYRFHFIQAIPEEFDTLGRGLPELGIEFKRYFSLPTGEVYHRIKLDHTQRRCRLKSPYLEHFCNRFHHFNNRIALPEQYESK